MSYPLHQAVRAKNLEAIKALLECRADPTRWNSAKQTPHCLAVALNDKHGSHDAVRDALPEPILSEAEKVATHFLRLKGFVDYNEPRIGCCGGRVYPLHQAVADKNVKA